MLLNEIFCKDPKLTYAFMDWDLETQRNIRTLRRWHDIGHGGRCGISRQNRCRIIDNTGNEITQSDAVEHIFLGQHGQQK